MRLTLRLAVAGQVNDLLDLVLRISGGRPRPGATLPNFVNPCSANRFRHARTVTGVTPTSAEIRALATPSAAISSAFARCTSRCAAVWDRDSCSKVARSVSDIGNGLAARPLMKQEYRLYD
jgi:hypothetical protein